MWENINFNKSIVKQFYNFSILILYTINERKIEYYSSRTILFKLLSTLPLRYDYCNHCHEIIAGHRHNCHWSLSRQLLQSLHHHNSGYYGFHSDNAAMFFKQLLTRLCVYIFLTCNISRTYQTLQLYERKQFVIT